jgi:hypothetical protein
MTSHEQNYWSLASRRNSSFKLKNTWIAEYSTNEHKIDSNYGSKVQAKKLGDFLLVTMI